MKKIVLKLVAFSMVWCAPSLCMAAIATANLSVSLTLTSICVVAATPLAFGTAAGNFSSNIDQTATLTVTCTGGTSYSVTLGDGSYPTGSGQSAQRRMRGVTPTNFVNYDLYVDSGRTTPWVGTTTQTGAPTVSTGLPDLYTVYGRVPPQTGLAFDVFSDVVVVTVTY